MNALTQDEAISKDSVQKLLEECTSYIVRPEKEYKEKGINLLNLLENLVKQMEDPYLEFLVNKNKIIFAVSNRDPVNLEKYVTRNFELLKRIDDKRELGLNYEALGLLRWLQGKQEEKLQAYIKAEELLREFGKPEDLIDANFNLALSFLKEKAWKKSITYGVASINAIQEVGLKKTQLKHLNIILATAYLNQGKIKEAKERIQVIENDPFYYSDVAYFSGKFNAVKGLYYDKQKAYEKAAYYYGVSSADYARFAEEKSKEVSSFLALENTLKLQEAENQKIRVENELNKERLRSVKYIFILCVITIIVLIVFGVNQFKASRYKSKVNQELSKNYEALVVANKKVDEALQVKSNFMDAVTHELLTPLNTIKGVSFLLQKKERSKAEAHQMKLINVSSDYLLSMIDSVIHLNSLDRGKEQVKKEPFNFKFLLNDLLNSSLLTKNKHDNKVHSDIDVNIPDIVLGDMLKVSQVITHLLDNAFKFTEQGDIYIKAGAKFERNKVAVSCEIKDTGIGISEEEKGDIFTNFSQGSVAVNRLYGGVGLGLSIVKKIIDLLEGEIRVDSEKHKGTTVFVCFVFDKAEGIEEILPGSKEVVHPEEKINVLLVEDNKVNQLITEKIITNYGFRCDSANDGEEAVALAAKNEYALILMDVMMPKMDGFEATKHIKGNNKDIPVVALTALSEELNKKKFNEVGIEEVLNKPVNPEKLYQTIVKYKRSMS
ncbi:response regulator [Aquimarina hainanensis]|uniref:histidine kinase n=1 Tax=Aquimarina hainanensis TaxID=1578017 RepID=A0ABW5N650_9FLAO